MNYPHFLKNIYTLVWDQEREPEEIVFLLQQRLYWQLIEEAEKGTLKIEQTSWGYIKDVIVE